MSAERTQKKRERDGARAYRFGTFRLDAGSRQLYLGSQLVPLAPKTSDVLLELVRQHGNLVTKEAILDSVWPGLFVEEDNIAQHVSRLRRILDPELEGRSIDTVPRRGYRFVAGVSEDHGRPARRLPPTWTGCTVGRDRERKELFALFEKVRDGSGAMAVISGEPGIGKTTLAQGFLSDVRAGTVPFLLGEGRCSERMAGTEAYLPVQEALESLVANDATGMAAALMRDIAPHLYNQLPFGEALALAAPSTPHEIKRDLLRFVRELAQRAPVILFLEDLHWAGESTVELLSYVGMRLEELPLLLLVTCRAEDLRRSGHSFLALQHELQAHGWCREWELGFLTIDHVARYLSLEFPSHDLPATFASMIHGRTEGSPLFVVELVRSMREQGFLFPDDRGRWILAPEHADADAGLPQSLKAIIARKVGRLDALDRAILTMASVQGDQFDAAVTAMASGLDPGLVEQRLEMLEDHEMLVRKQGEVELPDGTLTVRYRFVHVLYQEALYRMLTAARRGQASARTADALLRFHGDGAEEIAPALALLFLGARDFERAVPYCVLAAGRSIRLYAYPDAERWASRGLDALQHLGHGAFEREELALLSCAVLAGMAVRGFSSREVHAAAVRMREIGVEHAETRYLGAAVYGLFAYYENQADYANALAWGEEFLRLGRLRDDAVLTTQGHVCLGDVLTWMGEFTAALHHNEQAIALAGQATESPSGFDALCSARIIRAVDLCFLGEGDAALAAAGDALAGALALGEPPSLVFVHFFTAVVHQLRNEPGPCRVHCDEVLRLSAEHEFADFVPWAKFWRGWALSADGRPDEGLAVMLRSVDEQNALGCRINRSYMLALIAEAHARVGRVEDAIRAAQEGLAFAAAGERCYEKPLRQLLADLKRTPRAAS